MQDPRASIDKRVAMADIRGRFGYMKRALPNFIEVGRRMSEALSAGRTEEAEHVASRSAAPAAITVRGVPPGGELCCRSGMPPDLDPGAGPE